MVPRHSANDSEHSRTSCVFDIFLRGILLIVALLSALLNIVALLNVILMNDVAPYGDIYPEAVFLVVCDPSMNEL
jgi:hypothetical protein